MKNIRMTAAALALGLLALSGPVLAQDDDEAPAAAPAGKIEAEKVELKSVDEAQTGLVGWLFKPVGVSGKAPAVVLLHGRAGVYSSRADGTYNARTISQRHQYWARYWAERGYYALLVDSFSTRGYPGGFAAGTYNDRPDSINEVTIRPMDAYGGLKFLRSLPGVDGDRIGLMGWSNGGSATLATMADDKPGDMRRFGFRAAIAFYPGCGLKKRFDAKGYKAYAPVRVFIGTADEEVSPALCTALVERSRKLKSDVEIRVFEGATHSFDDPGRRRQSVEANAKATAEVRDFAARFFADRLTPR
jgi:carboxymethylenebutenolidase